MITFLRSIWIFLCRLGNFLYLRTGWYKVWSGVYRFFWERQFRDVPLRVYSDLNDLAKLLTANDGKWRADNWKTFGDAVSYPGKAQEVFDGKFIPTEDFDCDDFAVYTNTVLVKSLAAGLKLPLSDPKFFTVTWMTGWKPDGHNVCLICVPEGGYAYMDYGKPLGHAATPEGVARNVVERYAKGSDLICCNISEYNLTPVKFYWGS